MRINGIEYEVVRKTPTRRGYIRRKPDRTPTPRQLRNMLTFGEAAYKSFDKVETEGIPPAAANVQKAFERKRDEEFEERALALIEEERRLPLENIEFENALEVIKYLQL